MSDVRPQGAVELALQESFFGRFTVIQTDLNFGNNAFIMLKNNPERIGWLMVNTGGIRVTFRASRAITVGIGFVLINAGDTVTTNFLEDGQFPTLEMSIRADNDAAGAFLVEFIRDNKI